MRQLTNIPQLNAWVSEVEVLCSPNDVYLCNGSKEEYDTLAEKLVSKLSLSDSDLID
jgi:GTP-dependent phosphoenolpyruvate carboxykinase